MPKRLFISILGTGPYSACVYYDPKGDFVAKPTRFIQQATLDFHKAETWDENDRIAIFTTQEAKKKNWENIVDQEGKTIAGLRECLTSAGLRAEAIDIPDGKDDTELWQIFKTVYDTIDPKDEVYFDVTHGFRHLPMLVLVLINYAKFLKDITVGGITYGNYQRQWERMPIVDLMPITQLQDWTTAASEYLRYGYAANLKSITEAELSPLLRNDNLRTKNVINVNSLSAALENYSTERITCRGMSVSNGKSANKLTAQLNAIKDTGIEPLNPIFKRLKDAIQSPTSVGARCYDAAEWCFKKQLYQQAITFLLEGVNTFFCERNGIDIDDDSKRIYIGSAFKIKSDELMGRTDTKVVENSIISRLLNDELLSIPDVINKYTDLDGTRNDYNHAGFRRKRKPLEPRLIKLKVESALSFFKPILVEGKVPQKPIRENIFLNLSNHPVDTWTKEQAEAAEKFGKVVEMKFPEVPSDATSDDIDGLADQVVAQILSAYPDTDLNVHVMGEMTLTYRIVTQLKAMGVRCVASCTNRVVKYMDDGRKLSEFHFTQFREY